MKSWFLEQQIDNETKAAFVDEVFAAIDSCETLEEKKQLFLDRLWPGDGASTAPAAPAAASFENQPHQPLPASSSTDVPASTNWSKDQWMDSDWSRGQWQEGHGTRDDEWQNSDKRWDAGPNNWSKEEWCESNDEWKGM